MMKEVGLTEFPIGAPRPQANVPAILPHSAFDFAGWDGKSVGAVTHVLISNPTKGYGIFIENMLEEAE